MAKLITRSIPSVLCCAALLLACTSAAEAAGPGKRTRATAAQQARKSGPQLAARVLAPVGAPGNNLCANALVVTDGVTAYTNVGATNSTGLGGLVPGQCDNGAVGNGDIGSDVWFRYQATCTGELQITTCGLVNYDSKIGVYSNGLSCPTNNANLIGCADDNELGDGGAECTGFSTFLPDVPVVAGQWYLIRIGGFNGAQGSGAFELSCGPAGYGRCCLAEAPAQCGADITGPKGAGSADSNVDSLDYLLLIAEWGTPCNPMTPPDCLADITGPQAGVPDGNVDALDILMLIAQWGSPGNCPGQGLVGGPFCIEASESSCVNQDGAWEANVRCGVPCPGDTTGDECDDAIDLGLLTAGVTVSDTRTISVNAYTAGASDPVESCEASGNPNNPFPKEASWWYTFSVPPGCTSIIVSACNTQMSTQDTLLTLWQGDCGSLQELACDDDFCTFPAFGTSRLAYAKAAAGVTYTIFVDVYAGGALDVNAPIRIDVTCN